MVMEAREEVIKHKANVSVLLMAVIQELTKRAQDHDNTKLEPPEADIFEEFTPKLKDSIFGSKEYKKFMKDMKPALDHHYAHPDSRHHPQHFSDGINGMNLIDLIEMLIDWKAASMRSTSGDINRSLEINAKRFKMPKALVRLLENTVPFLEEFSENLQKGGANDEEKSED